MQKGRLRKYTERVKKSEKTLFILEAIKEKSAETADLLSFFCGAFLSPYNDSYRKLHGAMRYGIPKTFTEAYLKKRFRREEMHRFYSLLHYFEKQGFVERTKKGDTTRVHITSVGANKLATLSLSSKCFPIGKKDGRVRIVIFDIPETQRQDRDWFRGVLKYCEFSMLQKSVWIGKRKIPKELLEILRKKGLLNHVHILEITKTGTIRKIS
jgi:DNA-binding PadR family transcriptional regulator